MNVNFSTAFDEEIDDIMRELAGKTGVCVHKLVDIQRACRRATGYLKRLGITKTEWKGLTVGHRLPGSLRIARDGVVATRITLKLGGWGGQLINVEKLTSEAGQAEVLQIFVPENMLTHYTVDDQVKNHIIALHTDEQTS